MAELKETLPPVIADTLAVSGAEREMAEGMRKMFQIKMADLVVEIHHKYSYIEKQCTAWRYPTPSAQPDMVIKIADADIGREQAESEFPVSPGYCESICIYRAIAKKLTLYSAFVMHGAVVELDGWAYIFAAKSGVGKTTHTKLWIDYFKGRASYINGDKPVLRWRDGILYAYGTPWMGKEKFGRPSCAPVRAVCFLDRGDTNQIRRADHREIVERLFHQVLLPKKPDEVMLFMDMIDCMVRKVPFYILQCTISLDAVETAYEAMRGQA